MLILICLFAIFSYLQKAIQCLDREQFKLVQEALSERANFMQIAPHLSFPIPIMLPVYE